MTASQTLKSLHLEPFSLWFGRRLLHLHPEWQPFVGVETVEQDGFPVRTLVVSFPSANPTISTPLVLRVDLDQIVGVSWNLMPDLTASWENDWMIYFRPMPVTEEPWGVDAIAKWIESFMQEERLAFRQVDSDETGGSYGTIEHELLDGVLSAQGQTVVRSWRGTYDHEVGAHITTNSHKDGGRKPPALWFRMGG